MAKRYGGKYSPDGGDVETHDRGVFDGAKVEPAGARSNVLFVPPVVLVFTSLNDGAAKLALGIAAAGILLLAAWLLREGLRAEAEFNARKVARRPAFPRKMAASLLTGVGIALAAFKSGAGDVGAIGNMIAALLYGGVATALHSFAFGIDPLRSKGMEGIDTFQQNRVALAVDEAEGILDQMTDAIRRSGDRKMESAVEAFQTTARELFRTVEEDPRDLTSVRRYLGVYLSGARDATIKYADIYTRTRDAQAREDYANLLDDLQQNFAGRTRKMLLDDRSDLTVEIDVLRERLQREGVTTQNDPL